MDLISKSLDETNQLIPLIPLNISKSQRSPSKDPFSSSVKFKETLTENLSKKQKNLTAKYSSKELFYIKSRLNLELWIDEQLNFLYETDKELINKQENEVFSDDLIDKLVCSVTDSEKEVYLKKLLKDAPKPPEIFIDELIKRLKLI